MQTWQMGYIAALCSSLLFPVHAATLVEHIDFHGGQQKTYITATHARMEAPQAGQYMLIDLSTKKLYAINTEKRAIVELGMGNMMAKPPQMPPQFQGQMPPTQAVNAQLVHQGKGPDIAGFPTQHYQVMANGEVCSNDYLSMEAAKVANMASFIAAIQEMAEQRQKGMAQMPFMRKPPCQQATEQLHGQYKTLGVPMKSTDKQGQPRYEIANIKTDIEVAADAFSLPTGYEMLSEQQMMQQAMQRMQDAMQQQQGQMQPPQGPGFPMPMPQQMQQQPPSGGYPPPAGYNYQHYPPQQPYAPSSPPDTRYAPPPPPAPTYRPAE